MKQLVQTPAHALLFSKVKRNHINTVKMLFICLEHGTNQPTWRGVCWGYAVRLCHIENQVRQYWEVLLTLSLGFTSTTVINYLRLEQTLHRKHGCISTYNRKKKVLSDRAVNYKKHPCH